MLPATIVTPSKDWVDRVVIAAAATAKYSSIDWTIVPGMFIRNYELTDFRSNCRLRHLSLCADVILLNSTVILLTTFSILRVIISTALGSATSFGFTELKSYLLIEPIKACHSLPLSCIPSQICGGGTCPFSPSRLSSPLSTFLLSQLLWRFFRRLLWRLLQRDPLICKAVESCDIITNRYHHSHQTTHIHPTSG